MKKSTKKKVVKKKSTKKRATKKRAVKRKLKHDIKGSVGELAIAASGVASKWEAISCMIETVMSLSTSMCSFCFLNGLGESAVFRLDPLKCLLSESATCGECGKRYAIGSKTQRFRKAIEEAYRIAHEIECDGKRIANSMDKKLTPLDFS